ncbi:hypothetical protein ACF0H5_017581 [Mactra antiquata]
MAAKKMLIAFIVEELTDDSELEAFMLASNTIFGTLHLTVMIVCKTVSSLMSKFAVFPSMPQQLRETAEGFNGRCGMPSVVGAVDRTHIPDK